MEITKIVGQKKTHDQTNNLRKFSASRSNDSPVFERKPAPIISATEPTSFFAMAGGYDITVSSDSNSNDEEKSVACFATKNNH